MKNYNKLRKEAIETAVQLTDAMLCKKPEQIELLNFKLNDLIVKMLEKLNEPHENTDAAIERIGTIIKKWR